MPDQIGTPHSGFPNRPGRNRRTILCSAVTWVFVVGLAALIVWSTIQASYRIGRLASIPRVDDVIYMSHGAEWLRHLRDGSVGALVSAYIADPPHSPWAAAVALAGFVVFGIHDWAPYAMTFIQVLIALAVAAVLLRRVRLGERLACLCVFACSPVLVAGVQNFKPDYFAAILTAAGIMLALRRPFVHRARWVDIVTGALFGAALFVKPSIFALTGVILCASLGTSALLNTVSRRRLDIVPAIRRLEWTVLGCGLIAGPHFAVAAPKLARYMYDNMLGDRSDLWAPERSGAEHALFFLTGPSGQVMLGRMLWVVGGLLALALAVVAARRRRVEMLNAAGLTVMLLVTYLLATLNWMKILTFGLTFQTLLAFSGIAAAAYILGVQRGTRPRLPWASLSVLAAVAFSIGTLDWRFPQKAVDEVEGRRLTLRERDDVSRAVYQIVRGELVRPGMTVGVSGPHGDLNTSLLTLWLVRDGLDTRVYRIDDIGGPSALRRLNTFDLLIAHSGRTPMVVARRTSKESLTRVREAVVSGDVFKRVRRVEVPGTAGAVEVYLRVREP